MLSSYVAAYKRYFSRHTEERNHPVSYQTNEPMCTLTLTRYAPASKKQLRSLPRREIFYLLKEITEGVLGQVLGCDVREHLLGRPVVKGDLVLLDKLAHEEVPKGDMLGPGTEHAMFEWTTQQPFHPCGS